MRHLRSGTEVFFPLAQIAQVYNQKGGQGADYTTVVTASSTGGGSGSGSSNSGGQVQKMSGCLYHLRSRANLHGRTAPPCDVPQQEGTIARAHDSVTCTACTCVRHERPLRHFHCLQQVVNGSTSSGGGSGKGSSFPTWVIAIIVILVLVMVALVTGYIVYRKRAARGIKAQEFEAASYFSNTKYAMWRLSKPE